MRRLATKQTIALALGLAMLCAGIAAVVLLRGKKAPEPTPLAPIETMPSSPVRSIIGTSVLGRDIEAYAYGTGATHLLFVGGMHGGYEWNSVLLSYAFMDYLDAHPDAIPKNLTVTVIPSLNVDGVFKIIGTTGRFTATDVPPGAPETHAPGRFNAHGVDLNRNFACKWKPQGTWKGNAVSAGTASFSEPEALALRDFVVGDKPSAVVFWHSQANAVYASECTKGVLPVTLDVMQTYADATGYPAVKTFDAYPVTGDAEGWLASIGIPAITVELKTHEEIEWNKNLAGITALFDYFGR